MGADTTASSGAHWETVGEDKKGDTHYRLPWHHLPAFKDTHAETDQPMATQSRPLKATKT